MDKFGRAEWKNFNMAIAMLATTRSIDPRTKHGCYIVSGKNKPLTLGCNGPIGGINDDDFCREPPGKYFEIIHAEANAIINYNGNLDGVTVYVTGHPCAKCFALLAQKGVKKIVYGPIGCVRLDACKDECEALERMKEYSHVEFVEFDGDFWEPLLIMIKYLSTKGILPPKEFVDQIGGLVYNGCEKDETTK